MLAGAACNQRLPHMCSHNSWHSLAGNVGGTAMAQQTGKQGKLRQRWVDLLYLSRCTPAALAHSTRCMPHWMPLPAKRAGLGEQLRQPAGAAFHQQ